MPTKLPSSAVINHIRRQHHLKLILLHGSYATGQIHPHSDIDIAVLSQDPTQNLDTLSLIRDLSAAFQADSVDLTNLNHANPLLLKTVTNTATLLSGHRADFDQLQLLAFHRYSDYLPYLRAEHQFVTSRLNI